MSDVMMSGLSFGEWVTLLTAVAIFLLLLFTRLQAELVFLGGMAVLLVSGVLDAREALAGFSSSSVIVVALLFVVAAMESFFSSILLNISLLVNSTMFFLGSTFFTGYGMFKMVFFFSFFLLAASGFAARSSASVMPYLRAMP
jgi:hypothetical protein